MASYDTGNLRNIALVGHGGAGKTTLVEALLAHSGRLAQPGSVEKGNTVCDFSPQEKTHQHSLDSALVRLEHGAARVNLFDTPGFPDFIGQAIAVLPAVETAAVVINAQTGIEPMTRRMMQRAADRGLCRLIIVNKIDAENVDLAALLAGIQDAFGSECLPINLPTRGGQGVVDCFFNPAGESDISSVAEAHTNIVDQVVEVDEELMALYLEQGEELAPEQLHDPFEQALREGHLVPVCFVSARTGAGVPEFLDLCDRLLPNPAEGNPPPFILGEEEDAAEYHAVPEPGRHVLAHVFRIIIDPFVGKLALFRIHQGTVRPDTQLYIGDARKPFKVGHLLHVDGKDTVEVGEGVPGDICAVAKVDAIHRDAVLHDSHDEDHIRLRPLDFPTPFSGLAIHAMNRNDEQKLSEVLHKLVEEDPCLGVEFNQTTRETVLQGCSELHLRVTLEKMKERYGLEVETRRPSVAYRESISARAEGHHRHKKQTGGAGQFGEVFLRVEPLERGAGFEFASEVVGGAIPSQFIPAVEKGVREALSGGAIAGFPMQDVRVVVTDGKHHPVDSKEVAFATAGREAFLDAVRKARPLILEPIANVEVSAPADAVGTITGDLSGRRARINGTLAGSGGLVTISAQAPLSELDGYESQIKSFTGGHGAFSMEFSHYEPVPANIQQQLRQAHEEKSAGG